MNLKKITSGIAALALAFGAFAGLGITASAADPTYDANGIGEVVFGTNNGDGTVTAETFDDYANPSSGSDGWSSTSNVAVQDIATVASSDKTLSGYLNTKVGNAAAIQSTELVTYNTVTGYALGWYRKAAPVKSFNTAVTHGIVKFQTSYYQGTFTKTVCIRDSEGNNIIALGWGDNISSGNLLQIGNSTVSTNFNGSRGQSAILDNVEIDLDKGTITYDLRCPGRGGVSGQSGTKDLAKYHTAQTATFDNTDVAAFALTSSNNTNANYAKGFIDNVALYATMPATRHAVAVTVTDANGSAIEGAAVSVDGYRSVTTDSNGEATLYIDEDDLSKDVEVSADGYDDNTGSITEDNGDYAAAITMETAHVRSITASYMCDDVEVATKTVTVPEGALYGDSYTYVSTNYILGTNGKYYYVAADETTSATYSGNGSGHYALRKTVTLTADTVIEYDVTEIADEVVYYAEGEDISGLSPSNYHEGRYLASGDKVGAGSYAQTYTVERTGTYKITVALIANDGAYNTGLFRTAAYASAASASNSDGSVLAMNPSNNWYGYVFVSDAVDLTAGEVLTLKGFRGNGNLTPVDYMIVKDVTTGKVAATVNVAYSDGSAVSDATVTIGGYVATETETPGTYTADVPVGTHDVTVSKPGYSATGSDSIEVSDGGANTANVTMARTVYTIVTNPYASVSIDGAAAVSSGSTGSLTVTSGDADEHTIVITKGGYETLSTTVTPSQNETINLPLTASTGISYKEDFAYVDDNFGFASGVTVANGVLSLSVTGTTTGSTTIPETDVKGKMIHLVTTSKNASGNHIGYLNLDGTSLKLYYYGDQIRLHGTSSNTGFVTASGGVDVDIVISSTSSAASLYVNGRYIGWVNYSGNTLTGLSTTHNKGTFSATVDEISVIDYPGAANVTIGDASAVMYLKGTTITLPVSSTGYWTDGTSEYASGASYTVNNNVVFEEAYVITSSNCISAPSSTYTGTDVNFSLAEGCINLRNLKVTKTDDPSTELLVTDNGNGIYTFTMPAYPVTISADADCYVSHDENTVATDGYYAEGASITFSIADGREISVSPVVARTGDLKTTVSVTDNGDGTYTFSMPDHPVTIYAFAYTTPVEIERYNTDPVHHWYDTDTRTTGDGYYARGFTFSAFSGGRAMTSIAVTIDASKQADNEGNITNIGERITGASAVNSGKTSTVSGMNITGEAVFGIMIWTNDTEKVEAIKTFSPSGITIEIE